LHIRVDDIAAANILHKGAGMFALANIFSHKGAGMFTFGQKIPGGICATYKQFYPNVLHGSFEVGAKGLRIFSQNLCEYLRKH